MAMNMRWVQLKELPEKICLSPAHYKLYVDTLYPEQKENGIKYMGLPVEMNETEDFVNVPHNNPL